MKYREFGRNGLRASAVGLGCMGMSHTYGATADKKEAATQLADNSFYTTLQQQATLIGIKAILGYMLMLAIDLVIVAAFIPFHKIICVPVVKTGDDMA